MMQLILTFLPVYGIITTFALAIFFSGLKRWLILFLVPLATFLLFLGLGEYVLFNGNLLAAVIFGFYTVGLAFYYPALIIVAVIFWLKNRKKSASTNSDIPIPKPPEQ